MDYNVWADGTIIAADEYSWEEHSFMSDDYIVIEVPEDVDCPEEWIHEQLTSVDLGESCEQRTRLRGWLLHE